MEGPTPVSALIHAATMVAAGVYLLARAYPFFSGSPDMLHYILFIGTVTALMSATMGLIERDIKRQHKENARQASRGNGYVLLHHDRSSVGSPRTRLANPRFFKTRLYFLPLCPVENN